MKISHKYKYIDSCEFLYIYIDSEDQYEFGEEFLNNNKGFALLNKLKKYVKENISKTGIAIIVINGVIIGSIAIASISMQEEQDHLDADYTNVPKTETNVITQDKNENTDNTNSVSNAKDVPEIKEEDAKKTVIVDVAKNVTSKTTVTSTSKVASSTPTKTISSKPSSSVASTTSAKVSVPAPAPTPNPAPAPTPAPTPKPAPKPSTATIPTTTSSPGTTIKLSTNGTVVTMNLEDYIVGVVAAEMPASFHTEALKAQAVAARTFAMKKTSKGITLLNSTAHQVYKNESQLKTLWGSSFNTYYTKIKNAVSATKGKVLMYNNVYIDAVYHSMSNGKTELPVYVWSYSFPYLKCVSSTWDTSYSNFEVSKNMNYTDISSKLGITATKDTVFEVISYTESGRIENIKVGQNVFTGVKFRSLLGLRSTDISIKKEETSVTFTSKGYGHGVGMSQYGAHGAAKAGYTYIGILNHYYPGAKIVTK